MISIYNNFRRHQQLLLLIIFHRVLIIPQLQQIFLCCATILRRFIITVTLENYFVVESVGLPMLDLLGGRNEPHDEEAQEVSERGNEYEVFVVLHVLRCNLEEVLVYKVANLACDDYVAQVADPCNKSKHRSLYLRWNYLCK